MVCAASWLKQAVELDDGVQRILVVGEASAVLARLEPARGLRMGGRLTFTPATPVQRIAVVPTVAGPIAATDLAGCPADPPPGGLAVRDGHAGASLHCIPA